MCVVCRFNFTELKHYPSPMAPKKGLKLPVAEKKKKREVTCISEDKVENKSSNSSTSISEDRIQIQIQRNGMIPKQQLKVPPALNQFTKTLDKNLDEFSFSALLDEEGICPVSDENYANQMQIQDVLMSTGISSTLRNTQPSEQDIPPSKKGKKVAETSESRSFCNICFDYKGIEEMVLSTSCRHTFCKDCISKYVASKIRGNVTRINCPDKNCREVDIGPDICREIVPQQVLDTIRDLAPGYFLLQFHNISNKLTRIFETPIAVYKSIWERSSFMIPDNIRQWIGETFIESVTPPAGAGLPITISFKLNRLVDRHMSIIIEGASRTGKTEWARSLGKHNYFSGDMVFNKKTFSNDVEYNVIDNIAPKYLSIKYWKELIGAQHNWQAKCKYSKPVLIKGGVPAIILCNSGEGASYRDFLEKPINTSLKAWTYKNAIFEFIDGPLFQEQTREKDN